MFRSKFFSARYWAARFSGPAAPARRRDADAVVTAVALTVSSASAATMTFAPISAAAGIADRPLRSPDDWHHSSHQSVPAGQSSWSNPRVQGGRRHAAAQG